MTPCERLLESPHIRPGQKKALRNGVLVYAVPEDRMFAVIGDVVIPQICG